MAVERIYLIGFMGAGKTSVGRALAARLKWAFVDLDAEIERSQEKSIPDIFTQSGEPHFRRLESEHLKHLSGRPHVVIAPGGGAVMDPENLELMNSTGVTVWLNVSFETAARRVAMDGTRPLFKDPKKAEQLYESRIPIYRQARIHVPADNRPPAEIAGEVVKRLRKL
jgi:shikimate kinase